MEIIIELLKQRSVLNNTFVKMCESKCNSCAELALKALESFDTQYKLTIINALRQTKQLKDD